MEDNANFEEKSDEELVALTLRNQDFFAYLMRRYEAKLLRYIRRISGVNLEEAEDVLQESFIKIYQNLNGFDRSLKFSSWAYRITHNQVISHFRKTQARPQTSGFDAELIETLAADIDSEREMDRKLLRENLEKILKNIDPKYRDVLILKYFEEKDYQEISDIMQKPMGTVATLLNRAKRLLKTELTKMNISYE
jgi:RNA polymerase sigma-70 factor (ECF subfamily)